MTEKSVLQRLMTETWPAKMAQSALHALMLPGQVASGRLATQPTTPGMWSDEDEARSQLTQGGIVNRASDLAGLLMGGSYPAAQPGAVGIFGGRLAKTADHAALAKAEDMAAKGASRDQILGETGWFQGVDGKWRFEIDDSASVVRSGTTSTVGQKMDHKELYDAYPELKGIGMLWGEPPGRASYMLPRGPFEPEKIGLSQIDQPIAAREKLLHELQHAVQEREGFARGGTSGEFTYQNSPLFNERRSYEQPLDAYKRLAGEVEARSASDRADFTKAQRIERAPWRQDTSAKDQIVLFREGLADELREILGR